MTINVSICRNCITKRSEPTFTRRESDLHIYMFINTYIHIQDYKCKYMSKLHHETHVDAVGLGLTHI